MRKAGQEVDQPPVLHLQRNHDSRLPKASNVVTSRNSTTASESRQFAERANGGFGRRAKLAFHCGRPSATPTTWRLVATTNSRTRTRHVLSSICIRWAPANRTRRWAASKPCADQQLVGGRFQREFLNRNLAAENKLGASTNGCTIVVMREPEVRRIDDDTEDPNETAFRVIPAVIRRSCLTRDWNLAAENKLGASTNGCTIVVMREPKVRRIDDDTEDPNETAFRVISAVIRRTCLTRDWNLAAENKVSASTNGCTIVVMREPKVRRIDDDTDATNGDNSCGQLLRHTAEMLTRNEASRFDHLCRRLCDVPLVLS